MVYIESPSIDPYFNLALEQYVFDALPRNKAYFMLWQNDSTVVIGKHQNAAGEINAAFVKEHGIRVVRRLSGGGAVYHDLGNLNYTFIMDAGGQNELDLRTFCLPVVDALAALGVQAEINGRNDMTIGGKKFSGSAQYIQSGRVMHHGTMMFCSDLDILEKALSVAPDKYQSKGVVSVRSRVTNIAGHTKSSISFQEFMRSVRDSICGENSETYELSPSDMDAVTALRNAKYATWEWNYGNSPRYTLRKERRIDGVGKLVLDMEVENGVLTGFDAFGDFFGDGAAAVAEKICGVRMAEPDLLKALSGINLDACFHRLTMIDFMNLLLL